MMIVDQVAWWSAINQWTQSNPAALAELLNSQRPIPTDVRKWLAEAMAGKVKKKRGPRSTIDSKESMRRFFAEWKVRESFPILLTYCQNFQGGDGVGTPKERALAMAAAKFGMTEDQISLIVYPRRVKVRSQI